MRADNRIVDGLRLIGVPGANKVMAGELSRLQRRALPDLRLPEPKKQGLGSVVYPFDPRLGWLAVNHCRTCARVLWDLYQSTASRLEPLYRDLVAAGAADARPWRWDGARISVDAWGVGAFAAGARQIVGTVKNALIEAAARRGMVLSVDPERPDLRVQVRMYEDAIVVSLDLAGRPMHERGYRMQAGPAPLREDLAALLVMLARHDPRKEALIDPLAGAGTIAVEAACLARARPLWMSGRKPDAARHPLFGALPRPEPLFADTEPVVFAAEIDPDTRAMMAKNLLTAGVAREVEIVGGDFAGVDPARLRARATERGAHGGLVLTNPPYGHRLGARAALARLYRDLGGWCRELGWRAGVFVANPDFLAAFGAAFGDRPRIQKPLRNGPIRGYFYLYDFAGR